MSSEPFNSDNPHLTGVRLQEGGQRASLSAEALLLARIRAVGYAPSTVGEVTLLAAARVAASVDRQPVEIGDPLTGERVVVLGWAGGAAPDPDRHPSAPPRHLSTVPYLVWAACLAAAWPDPVADPYPGMPFRRDDILRTCVQLGAPHNAVVGALDTILPSAGLVSFASGRGVLGPAAAALPEETWLQLRRVHERLPRRRSPEASAQTAADRGEDNPAPATGLRKVSGPAVVPCSYAETVASAVVAALECAQGPVARADLPMLADPAIRASVTAALAASGRALVDLESGWTTGYLDDIATVLADEGWGTLTTQERAVLALVLLRTVAIPRARGAHEGDRWTTSTHMTSLDDLAKNRQISKAAMSEALRGLRNKGYVVQGSTGGNIPGPALARITPRIRTMLWEDLVLLGRPGGYMATCIRRQRESALRPGSQPAVGRSDEEQA